MSKFENLSDGIDDGFALFYIKDGKLQAVLLDEAEASSLDLMLGVTFGRQPVRITPVDLKHPLFTK